MKQKTKYIMVNTQTNEIKQHQSFRTIGEMLSCTGDNIRQLKVKRGFPFEYRGHKIYDRSTYNKHKRENKLFVNNTNQPVTSKINYDIKDSTGRLLMCNLSQSVAENFLTQETGNSVILPKGKFALPTNVKDYHVSESNGNFDVSVPNIQTINRPSIETVNNEPVENILSPITTESREYIDTLIVDGKPLTNKQWNVLYYFMQGKIYKEIGELLDKSPKTITGHMRRIFQKFDVSSQKELLNLVSGIPVNENILQNIEPIPQVEVTPNIVENEEAPFSEACFAIISSTDSLFMSQNANQTVSICDTEYDVLESHYERYGLPLELNNYKIYDSKSFNTNIMNNIPQPQPTTVPNRIVGDYYVYDINTQEVQQELTVHGLSGLLPPEAVDSVLSTGQNSGFPVSVDNLMIFDNANCLSVYQNFLTPNTEVVEDEVVEISNESKQKGWWNRITGK